MPDMVPALLIVVIESSPNSWPLMDVSAAYNPIALRTREQRIHRRLVHIRDAPNREAHSGIFKHPRQPVIPVARQTFERVNVARMRDSFAAHGSPRPCGDIDWGRIDKLCR